jgi:hypothetical protein
MKTESTVLSLTLEASNVTLAVGVSEGDLFSHYKSKAIELLKNDALGVHHFGMVPDNGAEGNDELLIDGTVFRFDVSQEILGVDESAAPHLVKEAFLAVVESATPSSSSLLEEFGATKKETTIAFHF